MEQTRILLAIVLSFLVFFAWNVFFTEQKAVSPPQPEQQTLQDQEKTDDSAYVPTEKQAVPATRPEPSPVATGADEPEKIVRVETPIYSVQISDRGAVFKSVVLNHYKQSIEDDSPPLEMISQENNPGTLAVGFGDAGITGWQSARFRADVDSDVVQVRDGAKHIVFRWESQEGVVVEKRFSFAPDSYLIDMTLVIRNGSGAPLKEHLSVGLRKFLPESKMRYGFEGASALVDGKLQQIDNDDIEDKNLYTGKLGWIAVQDRYFMSAIVPDSPENTSFRLFYDENHLLENQYVQPVGTLGPGEQKQFAYHLFFGPKSLKILGSNPYQLDEAVYFGWFDFIAKPCVWVMNFFYDYIPNYGLAIIFMTLLIKIILWPLGNKSYKSMAEMKKIQPLVTELREKYKNDKRKMNEEMMKLYRVYKVNPMGGCLPMALQIPVFFALYRMLYESIELRHAPFFGWINDLSAPDRLFHFGFSIPFMQPPYGIPVLTIIMGATMLLQQKMSPPPGDPAQAKMMMLMPIVFTVIFINFSSGLVLYWLVSNILSIAQQYYVQNKKA